MDPSQVSSTPPAPVHPSGYGLRNREDLREKRLAALAAETARPRTRRATTRKVTGKKKGTKEESSRQGSKRKRGAEEKGAEGEPGATPRQNKKLRSSAPASTPAPGSGRNARGRSKTVERKQGKKSTATQTDQQRNPQEEERLRVEKHKRDREARVVKREIKRESLRAAGAGAAAEPPANYEDGNGAGHLPGPVPLETLPTSSQAPGEDAASSQPQARKDKDKARRAPPPETVNQGQRPESGDTPAESLPSWFFSLASSSSAGYGFASSSTSVLPSTSGPRDALLGMPRERTGHADAPRMQSSAAMLLDAAQEEVVLDDHIREAVDTELGVLASRGEVIDDAARRIAYETAAQLPAWVFPDPE